MRSIPRIAAGLLALAGVPAMAQGSPWISRDYTAGFIRQALQTCQAPRATLGDVDLDGDEIVIHLAGEPGAQRLRLPLSSMEARPLGRAAYRVQIECRVRGCIRVEGDDRDAGRRPDDPGLDRLVLACEDLGAPLVDAIRYFGATWGTRAGRQGRDTGAAR